MDKIVITQDSDEQKDQDDDKGDTNLGKYANDETAQGKQGLGMMFKTNIHLLSP